MSSSLEDARYGAGQSRIGDRQRLSESFQRNSSDGRKSSGPAARHGGGNPGMETGQLHRIFQEIAASRQRRGACESIKWLDENFPHGFRIHGGIDRQDRPSQHRIVIADHPGFRTAASTPMPSRKSANSRSADLRLVLDRTADLINHRLCAAAGAAAAHGRPHDGRQLPGTRISAESRALTMDDLLSEFLTETSEHLEGRGNTAGAVRARSDRRVAGVEHLPAGPYDQGHIQLSRPRQVCRRSRIRPKR